MRCLERHKERESLTEFTAVIEIRGGSRYENRFSKYHESECCQPGRKPCRKDTRYLPEINFAGVDIKCPGEFPDGNKPGLAFSPFQPANGADGDP